MSTQPGDAHWLRRAPLRPVQTPRPGRQGGIKKTVETSKMGSVVHERVPSPFSAAMSGFPTAAPPVCAAPNCRPTNSAEGNPLASSVIKRCKHLPHLVHEDAKLGAQMPIARIEQVQWMPRPPPIIEHCSASCFRGAMQP
jgi:hypothetical protein